MNTVGHLINGEIIIDGTRNQDVFNPSTGQVSKQVDLASKATVEQAIASALAAYPAWRNTLPIKRARIMFKFKELLEQNADKICAIIGEEHGKISHDAFGELQRGIENVEYACGAPELLKGEHSKNVDPNIDSWSEFQPLGGAKNHAIVMPDADMDNAVNQLIGAAFGSSGERCMALPVAVAVGDTTADALVAKMQDAMKSLQVGAYSDRSNNFGPLITKAHQQKVVGYIDSAEEQGATIVLDGRRTQIADYPNGFFVGGTLIDNVTPEMVSYQEEIFGPVLQVVRVDTMQEAIDLIDVHEYGNGTCIFTRDGEAAHYFSDNIQVGMVGINIPLPVPVAYHSFGGWKRSLFGDLHIYGPDGVRFYTRRKTITQRWPSAGIREGVSFSFPQ